MGVKALALASMVAVVAPAAALGQSLVYATNDDWAVSASYGYSQRHHAGPWIRIDVGLQTSRPWTVHPHGAFHLLTPAGERIDLPDQRAFRRGYKSIQAMHARAATMQLSPWLAFSTCRDLAFVGDWTGHGGATLNSPRHCRTWRLWGNSDVDWTVTVGPRSPGGASLFFESPSGTWPDGEYTLVVDGPGDSVARLPINLGAAAVAERGRR